MHLHTTSPLIASHRTTMHAEIIIYGRVYDHSERQQQQHRCVCAHRNTTRESERFICQSHLRMIFFRRVAAAAITMNNAKRERDAEKNKIT